MKLYHYFRSSASYRARIALNFKGLSYEALPVDLRPPASANRSPEFLAVNPRGLVPVLVDGDRTITQSLAIIEYLEEIYPQPALLPRAPVDRAQVRALALAIGCEMAPLNNSGVLSYLRGTLKMSEDTVNAWYAHWLTLGFEALEKQVQRTGSGGRYVFGDAVTLADVFLVPQMYNARRFNVEVGPYPTLCAISAHLETLPAFAQAAPEAFAEA